MRPGTLTVRAVALLAAGSAAIHELRYAIGFGAGARHALGAHDHGYLAFVLPVAVGALVLAMALALMRVAHGRSASAPPRFRQVWLWAAFALALIYGVQETLEGAGAISGGGWIGLALALPAGLLIALALTGSAAAPAVPVRLARVSLRTERTAALMQPLAPAPRATRASARAPPLAPVV